MSTPSHSGPFNEASQPIIHRIGLTGGIGSGKSTVAGMLAERGATVLDADRIARSLTAPGGQAIAPIAEQFGQEFIDADGAMDRERMRAHAFAHPQARQQLERIIHPLVAQATHILADQAQAIGAPMIVYDTPLLVESQHWLSKLDHIVVVDCPEAGQIARVQSRNGLPATQVEAIIATQASRRQRRMAADTVLYNWGVSLEDLRLQVFTWARQFGL